MDNTAGHLLCVTPTLYAHVYIYPLISIARNFMHLINITTAKPAVQQHASQSLRAFQQHSSALSNFHNTKLRGGFFSVR